MIYVSRIGLLLCQTKFDRLFCYFLLTVKFIVIYSFQVCSIVEGQRYSRKLNERQVSGILKMACERPAEREKSVLDVS
jgi:hypothetical protein